MKHFIATLLILLLVLIIPGGTAAQEMCHDEFGDYPCDANYQNNPTPTTPPEVYNQPAPTTQPVYIAPTAIPTRRYIPTTSTPTPTPSPTPTPTPTPRPYRPIIRVFAEGTGGYAIGYPSMKLEIRSRDNNRPTNTHTWSRVTPEIKRYEYTPTNPIPENARYRIVFDSDGSWWEQDRNLRVDKITVGNTTYEAESPLTWSSGLWYAGGCLNSGRWRNEWLHCNGYFEFNRSPIPETVEDNQTRITINALGTPTYGRYPTMQLRIGSPTGQLLQTWENVTPSQRGGLAVYTNIYPSQIAPGTKLYVLFTNDDVFWLEDRDLRVSSIDLESPSSGYYRRYPTASSTVRSNGVWQLGRGCGALGYYQSEWLKCNGYFEFTIR